uniref:Gag-pol polyprotein n=1 Tax=Solanum tuberosum TaxID=4113 RepID=M1D3Z3_SOLTU
MKTTIPSGKKLHEFEEKGLNLELQTLTPSSPMVVSRENYLERGGVTNQTTFWSTIVRTRLDRFPISSSSVSTQVGGDKIKEQSKKKKKGRTRNYEYSQQKLGGGNGSQVQHKFSTPAPSPASVPSSKFRNDKKSRALGSKSQQSVTGSGGNANRAQSTTSAALEGRPTQQGNTFGTGGGQHQNRLYALQAHQDQEDSPDVVTGTLRIIDLDVYAVLDPGATLSFVTPYIAVKFDVSPETLSEPFSVSTSVGDPVIARRV